MVASWKKVQFGESNDYSIELNDPSCNKLHENVTFIWIAFNFTDCGSIINGSGTNIIQGNTAKLTVTTRSNSIERSRIYSHNMKCEFSRMVNVSTKNSFNVTTNKKMIEVTSLSRAQFNLLMAIFEDVRFNKAELSPIEVSSYEPIYTSIWEKNKNKLFKFVVRECYATPTASKTGPRHTFFHNKCPADDTFAIVQPTHDHTFNFVVRAFKFIQISKSVYFHCDVYVCKHSTTSSVCTQECDSLRKRRAPSKEVDAQQQIEEISVSSNQIVFVEKQTCADITCPLHSRCVNMYPAECKCDHGYVRNRKRRLCGNQRMLNIYGMHLDMEFRPSYVEPYSEDFLKLAADVEKQLMYFILRLGDNTIDDLKVHSARKGSVVVDVMVVFAKTSNKQEAYKSFLKSISNNHTNHFVYENAFKIKSIVPTMDVIPSTEKSFLIISIIVSLLAVFMIIITVIKLKYKLCSKTRNKENLWGINNE